MSVIIVKNNSKQLNVEILAQLSKDKVSKNIFSNIFLTKLLYLIDEKFFNFTLNTKNFTIIYSNKLKKTLASINVSKKIIKVSNEIISSCFSNGEKSYDIGGILCYSKQECLLHAIQHELIHYYVIKICNQMESHGKYFKKYDFEIFGHTKHTHQIFVGCQEKKQETINSLKIGDIVKYKDGIYQLCEKEDDYAILESVYSIQKKVLFKDIMKTNEEFVKKTFDFKFDKTYCIKFEDFDIVGHIIKINKKTIKFRGKKINNRGKVDDVCETLYNINKGYFVLNNKIIEDFKENKRKDKVNNKNHDVENLNSQKNIILKQETKQNILEENEKEIKKFPKDTLYEIEVKEKNKTKTIKCTVEKINRVNIIIKTEGSLLNINKNYFLLNYRYSF